MTKSNKKVSLDKQDKILISNMIDKYNFYQKTGKSTSSNFLNPYEIKIITSYLNCYHIPYFIYEPYDFLEKKVLYFGKYDNFITIYQIKGPLEITHSQVLGSLFAIGFHENTIGDIFVEKGIGYYVNLTKLNAYLEENLTFIGNQPVQLTKIEELNICKRNLNLITILASSMRTDNIISKITGKSRNQVKRMFSDKRVFLNYQELRNPAVYLKEEDILSIYKIGKFRIGKQIGITKKENIILEIYQYV